MASKLFLAPDAVADVADAYAWYEEQAPGLGDNFLICLDEAYEAIAATPRRFPVRFDTIRRILIRRFPYAIYFEDTANTIVVHYVFHCAQNPQKLKRRMQ